MRRRSLLSPYEDELGMHVPPPTPDEIRERAAAVRAGWPESRWRREGGVVPWSVPRVADPRLIDDVDD